MTITVQTNTPASRARLEIDQHAKKAADANARLASGSKLKGNPAAQSIATTLKVNNAATEAVIGNMESGSSMVDIIANSYSEVLRQLTDNYQLATQASSNILSPDLLEQLNLGFQRGNGFIENIVKTTNFNNKELLSGGAGVAVQHDASAAAMTGNQAPPANTFAAAPFVVADASGFITGAVSNATVTGVPGNYDLSVTVGNDVFSARGITPVANGVIPLVSTNGSRISLTLAADVTGITSATDFQDALRQVLGLTEGNSPASFKSTITANNNGVTGVVVSGAPELGEYVAWSVPSSNKITLSNGTDSWTEDVTRDGAQSINFSNGISLALDATYVKATGITNIGFKVNPSAIGSLAVTLQSGTRATDVISANIAGVSTKTLGIDNLDITTQANAQAAKTKLDQVIKLVSGYIADIQAFQQAIERNGETLKQNIVTNEEAYARLNDADIYKALEDENQAMLAMQVAISAFHDANEFANYALRALN